MKINRDLKEDDAFNTTWWPVLSIDKCYQVTSLSIERTVPHLLLNASCCLRSLISRDEDVIPIAVHDVNVIFQADKIKYGHTSQF